MMVEKNTTSCEGIIEKKFEIFNTLIKLHEANKLFGISLCIVHEIVSLLQCPDCSDVKLQKKLRFEGRKCFMHPHRFMRCNKKCCTNIENHKCKPIYYYQCDPKEILLICSICFHRLPV